MPFFSRNAEPEEEIIPTQQEPEIKRHGLFGSLKRESSPSPSTSTSATNGTRNTATTFHSSSPPQNNDGGLFRRSTDAGSIASSNGGRSFLQRSFGHGNGSSEAQLDPSILQARERVLSAETAEREADRALDVARHEVREARDHVRRLELEAKEEARRAKIKQFHAREVSRRAKPLGRHDI